MVPVLNKNRKALMPCSEKRARRLMQKGEAKALWQKGIFCIQLTKEPSDNKYQQVILGIDTGSKREGYTVATAKSVILNITTNTPYWVKKHIETRRNLRRNRRYRKAPYRACRENRAVLRKENRIPPSTKARWGAKLRIIKLLSRILPLTNINIEDIQARTIKGDKNKKWNSSFSPLEVGKKYFDEQITTLYPTIILHKTSGRDTKLHRDKRGFAKSKSKLDYIWEAHNVDSHSLTEITLQKDIKPYKGLYKIEFLEYHRRQLHIQNFQKGHIRKPYGTIVSAHMSRGSVLKYKDKFCYLGGSSKGKVAIHSIITGKRMKQHTPITDIKRLYTSSWRTQFVPRINPWVSLRDYL